MPENPTPNYQQRYQSCCYVSTATTVVGCLLLRPWVPSPVTRCHTPSCYHPLGTSREMTMSANLSPPSSLCWHLPHYHRVESRYGAAAVHQLYCATCTLSHCLRCPYRCHHSNFFFEERLSAAEATFFVPSPLRPQTNPVRRLSGGISLRVKSLSMKYSNFRVRRRYVKHEYSTIFVTGLAWRRPIQFTSRRIHASFVASCFAVQLRLATKALQN